MCGKKIDVLYRYCIIVFYMTLSLIMNTVEKKKYFKEYVITYQIVHNVPTPKFRSSTLEVSSDYNSHIPILKEWSNTIELTIDVEIS